MLPQIRLLAFALILSPAIFGTARFSGEKGARAHRTRLSAGSEHACALLDDGTAACWGNNQFGQLGDSTFIARTAPVPVTNLGGVVSIAQSNDRLEFIVTHRPISRIEQKRNGRYAQEGPKQSRKAVNSPLQRGASVGQ